MSTKASSMITLVDISDIKMSSYLTANYPTTQIYDTNTETYTPNWTALTLTPVVFINDSALSLTSSGLSITYKRQDGNGSEANVTSGETASAGKLTISQNKLSASPTGILTYICYIAYTDPNSGVTVNSKNSLTFSLVKQGEKAHTASISGEQLFKYDKNGALTSAAQITLTASTQNVTISKWQYKNSSGNFVDYPTTSDNSSITGGSLIVKPAHAVFVNNTATIKVTTSDENCYDIFSITKLYDGATGAAAVSPINVIMSNEAQVLPATNGGLVSPAVSITTKFTAYRGTTAITPTIASLPTAPSGMSITQQTSGNTLTVTMAVANNATLGSASTYVGTIDFTVAAGGQNFTKTFSWSKAVKGNTGAAGAAGADAIVFDCVLTNGNVIYNGSGSIAVSTVFYKGASLLSSGVTYQWAKYSGGSWGNISGATSASYTITAANVTSATSFRCAATYSGKTYYAYCTIYDKTDPYSCEIFSSIGTQIVNSEGEGGLYCRVWQSGQEVDPLKSTTFSATAPSSPASGDFYYKVDKTSKTVTLMKYSGSAWAAATGSDLPSLTYHWSCLDKSGNELDIPSSWTTEKAVYIDASIINQKISVYVDVE